jgi:hypothetical protein
MMMALRLTTVATTLVHLVSQRTCPPKGEAWRAGSRTTLNIELAQRRTQS